MMLEFTIGFCVFPARAGMINPIRYPRSQGWCIPRESGDDPRIAPSLSYSFSYSPRERG